MNKLNLNANYLKIPKKGIKKKTSQKKNIAGYTKRSRGLGV